jgi:hypothetical protein
MRQLLAGLSRRQAGDVARSGVCQVPRALSVGLHLLILREWSNYLTFGQVYSPESILGTEQRNENVFRIRRQ